MTADNPNQATPVGEQGSLFVEQTVRSGSTEPGHLAVRSQLEVAPEGAYSEPVVAANEVVATPVDEVVHEAVKTDHRRAGQLGKHSSIERTGSYAQDLKVGDFLPGFGPVTYSNLHAAQERAHSLDAERSQR